MGEQESSWEHDTNRSSFSTWLDAKCL
jgi:hypothetical protein